ncbi:MAG: Asp-tRNA(Asn)/Glu-tRNA(Gln) amidotransferase subunit GatB [Betaproteobacteria bacterium]|nr:Asp-tRNA(Asn)/Glu-tRNA(Gln) amidotransferase subunit GatB [Betaproteobacteria bacterium]
MNAPQAALVRRAGRTWEVVIGLETHVQLATASKMFSGAATAFGAEPNTQACAVDLALPGVLPVANRAAVACAIRFGLAVGAHIAPRSVFARKNYFYPDLPKGYQISQYETPVVAGGELTIAWEQDGAACERAVRLTRAHLEEDAGKSLHEDFHGYSGIDLNRAGTPLLEIVTEPDLRSAREAVAYARALHGLVVWLGICDGNMQEGSFRCDANVSVRIHGSTELGTRCEIKNLNSFRFLERAIEFEVRRQIDLIDDGGRVVQETRLYDPDRDETRSMRSKEDAHDYRYFPDPDLPTLEIDAPWIETVRASLPELPSARRERYQRDYALSPYDATTLTASRATADYFEAVLGALGTAPGAAPGATSAKSAANWVMGEVAAALNRDGLEIAGAPVTPGQVATLIRRIDDGTVSGKIARELFALLWADPQAGDDAPDRLIDARGLKQISDGDAIGKLVDEVMAANPKSVEEFRAGKDKAFNALVGQVMKASRGKANPQQVNELLRARLGGSPAA